MELEFKGLQLEIKSVNEKGVFKGIASPFNNIDYGNDRVLPSISKKNNGKTVPYLWYHDVKEPIGEVKLTSSNNGIEVEGKLYLDTLENGNPTIPNAYKAYTLMKNNKLKNSIGYKVLDYEYKTEGNKTIRNLKDIDIIEVSAVTFPMNPKAKITDVKSEEGGNKLEEKAMSFGEVLNLRKANESRWQLMDALNISFRQLIEDNEMKVEEKVAQLNKNVDEFAAAYKEVMSTILKAKASGKKGIDDILETKEEGMFETKAGAKISKANKDKLKSTLKAIKEILGDDEQEEETEDKSKEDKKPKDKKEPKDNKDKPKDEEDGNKDKDEKKSNDEMEFKADELEALEGLYKTITDNKEEN
ncbi:hypothetical protein FDF74_11420 [Clostridium niameyense]|uniref:Prohead serine protease domain-containing protein n=1 Tax=Clostridium niameyense TaxID=1622073 RepID=A0A6M0RDB5_9CLOT|nr:HK97 family phage prohead protease [Clostridium niameyense]NEZ47790.1 hypothetical protein [Clostridium niameyense]